MVVKATFCQIITSIDQAPLSLALVNRVFEELIDNLDKRLSVRAVG